MQVCLCAIGHADFTFIRIADVLKRILVCLAWGLASPGQTVFVFQWSRVAGLLSEWEERTVPVISTKSDIKPPLKLYTYVIEEYEHEEYLSTEPDGCMDR